MCSLLYGIPTTKSTQANSDKTPHRIYTNEENKNPNQKLDKTLFTPENLVYFHHYK